MTMKPAYYDDAPDELAERAVRLFMRGPHNGGDHDTLREIAEHAENVANAAPESDMAERAALVCNAVWAKAYALHRRTELRA